ncbi:MAG: hypothetical protein GY778_32260 [bacterium]|nr:hypothetical protein [bacterium]
MSQVGRHLMGSGLLVAITIATSSGCSNPQSTRAATIRQERIASHWHRFAEHEADGERRLQRLGERIAAAEHWHAEHRRVTDERLAVRWQFEVQRWHDGQPEYRRRIERECAGNWANADRAAHLMFD